ncbi:hypothetical protein [Neoaquamicrobium sediminum]|uniref:hypothetical protein n=1 Tax=Neoaquamicrobium sediminum TaxID=1849104 RepID=UPI00156585CF|nr:hypothetical protein [Mesorhizobium sediminum]NRC54894.1 hypothetical protein [Mesorhizobium sediminum]
MNDFAKQISEAVGWLRDAASKLTLRRDRAPIATVARVDHFARSRAALITQKKLYGYLKERIGTRYPKMFDDELFAQSINVAKMHVFAASLSDMTIYAVAQVSADGRLEGVDRREWALACYRAGLADNADQMTDAHDAESWVGAFIQRIEATLWENVAVGGRAFTESPKALIKWAPIADELKMRDREIVENSIRFAWNEVIRDFRARLDADAAAVDWRSLHSRN